MSWSGFKKNVGRATTQVMMKTGHVEKTSDREYEVEERRYRTLEAASLRLQKEAKGYLDSLRAMTASQMRIAETIDAFYGDSGAKDGVSRSYKQAVEDLDAETVKALDGPYRCVTQDPELQKIAASCINDVLVRVKVLQEIEAELNWEAGNCKNYTRDSKAKDDEEDEEEDESEEVSKLIESVYRTTVLEPISRFCAYFPDINECIKKRNHKMLDYDAMRSKVKKLTEKPDKDPSKLPRTEKETEMVNITNPFRHMFSVPSTPTPLFLSARDRPKNKHHSSSGVDEDATPRSAGLKRSPGMVDLTAGITYHGKTSKPTGSMSALSTSSWKYFTKPMFTGAKGLHLRVPVKPLTDTLIKRLLPAPFPSISDTARRSSTSVFPDKKLCTQNIKPSATSTLFFNPSELEHIMGPLRAESIERYTDLLTQAKAAYDQLNEQLTNELPQLIDLRVPYLDPSFEALVKIQLRFCAEAYSRMAQVQQYLDASTRDQYASGDLDARVEDVLGQIRELSIAGTV